MKIQNKMARCECCGKKICTRENRFYPDLCGYLCFDCEQNQDLIKIRTEEIKQILKEK